MGEVARFGLGGDVGFCTILGLIKIIKRGGV